MTHWKQRPPITLEPDEFWGTLAVVALNLVIWSPYLIVSAILLFLWLAP